MRLKLCESVMSPAHQLSEMDFMDSHAIYNITKSFNEDLAEAYRSLIQNAFDELIKELPGSRTDENSSACTLGATPTGGSQMTNPDDMIENGKVIEEDENVIRVSTDIPDDFSLVEFANDYINSQNLKYRIQGDTILVSNLYFKIFHDVDNKKLSIECGNDANCNGLLDYIKKSTNYKFN